MTPQNRSCLIIDSSTNLLADPTNHLYLAPLWIVVEENGVETSYQDLVEINQTQIITHLQANHGLKTAQTNLGQMLALLEQLSAKYERIFVLPISKHLSSSYNTWLMAQQEFSNHHIVILDGNDIGAGNIHMVQTLLTMLEEQADDASIINFVQNHATKRHACLVVQDVTQLQKGGRISAFKAKLIGLLKFHIIINFDGNLTFEGKERNLDQTIQKCLHKIDSVIDFTHKGINGAYLFSSLQDANACATIAQKAESIVNHPFTLAAFPNAILSHVGLNAFAFYIITP